MLKEKIEKDYIDSYKMKDEFKIGILRLIRSTIKNSEIETKRDLTDDEVIQILKREVKQRKDTLQTYEKSGHQEAAEHEKTEIEFISSYLPAQLDDNELKAIIAKVIETLNANSISQMGQVIALVMKKHGNEVDGAKVSAIAKELLLK